MSLIIDDSIDMPTLNTGGTTGCIPRDFSQTPFRTTHHPDTITLIPRNEWADRIRMMEHTKSRLSDIRNDSGPNGGRIPSLDQNDPRYMQTRNPRWGYCWAHGPVAAVTLLRAKMNRPFVPLSAFGVAYTIKQGKDEGAWGALAYDFIAEKGIPPEPCPQHPGGWTRFDQQFRQSGDRIWEDAKLYKIDSGFAELSDPVWDRDMQFDAIMTCLLNNIPVVGDYDWWGHCVCIMDPVLLPNNKFGTRIWNSWGDSWQGDGTAVLTESKMIPNNAIAPVSITLA